MLTIFFIFKRYKLLGHLTKNIFANIVHNTTLTILHVPKLSGKTEHSCSLFSSYEKW
ncbi:hypothetical protein C0J52_16777 [Blattella germanica]|nr:hypothetical protein C0J52_16777 [Blattella germanica]